MVTEEEAVGLLVATEGEAEELLMMNEGKMIVLEATLPWIYIQNTRLPPIHIRGLSQTVTTPSILFLLCLRVSAF